MGGPGTLLLDMPVMGWNDADVWWIGQSVGAAAKEAGVAIPLQGNEPEADAEWDTHMENAVFERWCLRTFIDRSTGMAKLVQSTRSRRGGLRALAKAEALRVRHPSLEVVQVATWMARGDDEVARRARAGTLDNVA